MTFLIDVRRLLCLWRCTLPFLLKLSKLLPSAWAASTFDHQFVELPSCLVVLGVCLLCTRLSKHFSAVHSVVIVFVQGTSVSYLNSYLSFEMCYIQHTESRSSLACNQNITKTSHSVGAFPLL